jgi:hypothetical protein
VEMRCRRTLSIMSFVEFLLTQNENKYHPRTSTFCANVVRGIIVHAFC